MATVILSPEHETETNYTLFQIKRIIAGEVTVPLMPDSQVAFLKKEAEAARKNLRRMQIQNRWNLRKFQRRFRC